MTLWFSPWRTRPAELIDRAGTAAAAQGAGCFAELDPGLHGNVDPAPRCEGLACKPRGARAARLLTRVHRPSS
jgi:hypothetical protein